MAPLTPYPPLPSRSRLSLFLLASAVLAAALYMAHAHPGSQAHAQTPAIPPAESPTSAPAQPPAPPSDALRLRRTPVVQVFEECKDAVVNISSTQVIQVQSPLGVGTLFDELFELPNIGQRDPLTRQVKRTSVGSGFVIHSSGYVVTNAHVVSRTVERKVIFPDKTEYDAQVVAIDADRDLAVLKIEAKQPLHTLKLGRSADLMVGETVIAIGNPLGYQHTVTSGVVSALDRSIAVGEGVEFKGLIQTDASINPGNSGGPLLNVLGELIGINTAIRGDAQNIGFAIPVDHLRQVLPDMLAVERRYRIITGMRIGKEGPAKVLSVISDSPAFLAGLQPGDVITSVNSQPIGNAIDYSIALIGRKRGESLRLTLTRDGRANISTDMVLAGRPKPDGDALLRDKFGITADPLSQRTIDALGLRGLRGLEVRDVEPNSPAKALGMRRGDIIDHLAGAPTVGLDEVGEIIETIEAGRRVPISVLRVQGRTIYRTQTSIEAR
ncbi:MAG: trypsin-like peptidase domain-containing protein [Planctomycetes bacterium]|nr:trypsin-like peptidase domain-containing protein [Planctomycetota bacterium]